MTVLLESPPDSLDDRFALTANGQRLVLAESFREVSPTLMEFTLRLARLAFPGILLALFITAVLGPSLATVVFALSFTGWAGYARLARAQVLTLREREYVQAARALGSGPGRILFRHLRPNAAGPLLVQVTFALPGAIFAEASLSFLGLGVPPGTPSWGALVDQGTQYLLVAPHVALFPGVALALTVLGFNLLGDALDPRHLER